jgi:hypothetical protein
MSPRLRSLVKHTNMCVCIKINLIMGVYEYLVSRAGKLFDTTNLEYTSLQFCLPFYMGVKNGLCY